MSERDAPLAEDELARLRFLGAAGGVTGSCYLVHTRTARVLVDCGSFQGGREARLQNRRPFEFDPAALDAVLLTHAHIDHSGRLPKLVADGWRGPIRCTPASASLLGILLRDSAHLAELDARHEQRRRERQGEGREDDPIEPLYTSADAEQALAQVREVAFGERVRVAEGLEARWRRAGHILGAASIELWVREGGVERCVVFSGDLGRSLTPGLALPDPPQTAHLALLESTYGDRDHRSREATLEELAQALRDAAETGGNVVVPAFAVGRSQQLLWHIGMLEREGRIPVLPVYLDSPMAIDVAELYPKHPAEFQEPLRSELARGGRALVPQRLELCRTPEESMALNAKKGIVVLSASGMAEGGRVLHHLRHNLPRPQAHVIVVGFQARGTTGRALVDGARSVRIFGEQVEVNARVHTIGGFSAHAGQTELVEWVSALAASGAEIALVHGEDDRRRALAARLAPLLARPARLPQEGESVSLRLRGAPVAWADQGR